MLEKDSLVQWPMVDGGAIVPVVNFEGVAGRTRVPARPLANIYLGKVAKWDDPAIANSIRS